MTADADERCAACNAMRVEMEKAQAELNEAVRLLKDARPFVPQVWNSSASIDPQQTLIERISKFLEGK